ncbi:gliding motility-associated C-terminal domain-containing protein [Dyadobacter sp. CY323]|uniref:gliding motility-associated C-terminal domain-containing protein n=1 Tax=Dyadobacter sp. CY323 TaxID=2907302 RepID=UPI001F2659F0|nr:gliding motility-associated C-terminal domain-containing protein [Dyadobacter sp. CY323]MCE6989234.1 gliding motility-associated C-terminal domain-containing protein [Dyadobacter sp. CY323]
MSSKAIKVVIYIFIFSLSQANGIAENIIGGYLQINAVSTLITRYKISLKLHIDETNGSFASNELNVKMIRRSNGSEVESFRLLKNQSRKVTYNKEVCIGNVELKTIYANFESEVELYPPSYSDMEGYYLEWTDCCRQVNVVNLNNSGSYTTIFRTFFPPIFASGVPFFNSTPTVDELNTFFICKQGPFSFKIAASDIDGDKLRFFLVDPIGYHFTSNSPLEWQKGYAANNAIPGNPSLKIDPETGMLSVTSETIGLFTFAVCVEEYRNGRRIGSVIREFTVSSLDQCSSATTDKNVYLNDVPVTNATICPGNEIKLDAKLNLGFNCQWMRNGQNIPGAMGSSLEVVQEGDYSFKSSQSGSCPEAVESEKVHVSGANTAFKLEKQGASTPCDKLGEAIIEGPKNLHSYNWYKNGSLLTVKSNSLAVSEPGSYWAVIESFTCKLFSDTVVIQQFSDSSVKIEMDPIAAMCANQDTAIHLIGMPTGGVFKGAGIVGDIFYPIKAGVGVHELIYSIPSTEGCSTAAARQIVEIYDSPKFNLLPEICVVNEITAIGVEDSHDLNYEWSPKDGLDNPLTPMPTVTTDKSILYTVIATDHNGCKTAKTIQVKICDEVSIPDIFTPNQDGINDSWELRGIDNYPYAEVTIYNRWGRVIFHSSGTYKPFDGSKNTTDIYYYKIKLNEALPLRSGALMLVR